MKFFISITLLLFCCCGMKGQQTDKEVVGVNAVDREKWKNTSKILDSKTFVFRRRKSKCMQTLH